MGRSTNKVPDDSQLSSHLKKSDRFQLIKQVTSEFWKRWTWTEEATPENVIRQRWHELGRILQVVDVVLIHESSPIKGKYILGRVDVKVSEDELVRSYVVGYRIPSSKESTQVTERSQSQEVFSVSYCCYR